MSPARKPSSVVGLRHAVAGHQAEPAAPVAVPAPERRPRPDRPKPIRFTLDLDPARHEFLKSYADGIEAGAAEVMRALLDQLRDDPGLADRVRDVIWQVVPPG
jgi:hypothetical protein